MTFPLLFILIRLMLATLPIIIIEPIHCRSVATSLNITIPQMKESTVDKIFVTVTMDMSAVFKTFSVKYQLSESINPFSAKIKIKLVGIDIPEGIHIKLTKKAILVNIASIEISLLFFKDSFLNTLKKPINVA